MSVCMYVCVYEWLIHTPTVMCTWCIYTYQNVFACACAYLCMFMTVNYNNARLKWAIIGSVWHVFIFLSIVAINSNPLSIEADLCKMRCPIHTILSCLEIALMFNTSKCKPTDINFCGPYLKIFKSIMQNTLCHAYNFKLMQWVKLVHVWSL